jgi:hypothetical protein
VSVPQKIGDWSYSSYSADVSCIIYEWLASSHNPVNMRIVYQCLTLAGHDAETLLWSVVKESGMGAECDNTN